MNNYELAVKNGFIGTEQDYLDSLVGEANDTHIVSSKPNIADDTTELKTWYYYQIDGNGSNTAWKYKMYLPTTADLTAGKYAVYYSMKPYRGEFTVDTPAMTNKDTYRYYVIMDLNAITTTIYKESIADGTTEVLETVQCEQKEPTDEYIIIDEPMEQLGQWVQTLYIGSTKEDASEVTLTTGTSVTGFITTLTFEEIVGNRSNLLTADKTSIVNAINEHDKLLRNSNADVLNTTSKNIVGAINELESKHYLEVFDLQGGSVLDYAKTFKALTHNYFYANNCSDLPNSMNYGYCSVDVSQDPLYRDITFYCPTSGRIYVNTIGANEDLTGFGEWSGWHEFLMKEDIVTTLDDTDIHTSVTEKASYVKKTDITTTIDSSSTDTQVPSAKSVYDNTDNIFDTRLENNPPSYYYNNHNQHVVREMKLTTAIGINNSEIGFVTLLTYVNWCDISAPIYQIAIHYKQILIRNNIDGDTWTKWKRLYTTSVEDVPITDITIPNGLFQTVDSDSSYIKYEVVNGIAFVYFSIRGAKIVSSGISRNITIPKLKTSFNHTIIGEGCSSNLTILANGTNMQIWTLGDEIVTTNYSGCISYPVSES